MSIFTMGIEAFCFCGPVYYLLVTLMGWRKGGLISMLSALAMVAFLLANFILWGLPVYGVVGVNIAQFLGLVSAVGWWQVWKAHRARTKERVS
ncbi:hypothetical protein C1Y63_12090 [Corynebacterium sp. 13CS0277]|uniref:hypothetical protein n=1 Tax=Corynebacterium sp. 13CS0277 TaxID=2071994 RepID=UPI000D0390F8|nr:hypothetical protein [Corynebacterium sp. 13CS0277]PRQ10320.1 hypothetical protein C1Y63_12090 [Corynebacterium sp. 13CS0277]